MLAVVVLFNSIFIFPSEADTIEHVKSAVLVVEVGDGLNCARAVWVFKLLFVPSCDT